MRNMDWDGAEEMADRYKKMLPPQLQENEDENGEQKQLPPEVQAMIEQGKTEKDIAEYDFDLWTKQWRNIIRYKMIMTKPRQWEMEIIVCQGPTGTGKSKYCNDNFPNAYWKTRGEWWDGYEGEEQVIIDEFYGWLPWDFLLRLCDRYPLKVPIKNGFCEFTSKTIIFTTNEIPNAWYKNCKFDPFARRVTKWIVFPVWGEKIELDRFEDAISHFILNQ